MVCAGIARAAGLVQTRLSGCRLTLSIEGRAGDPAPVLSLTANVGPSLPCAAVPPPHAAPLLVEVGTKRGPPVVVCSLPPAKLSPPRDASFRRPSTDPDVRLQASCLSKPLCNASTGEPVCSGRHSISSPPPFAPWTASCEEACPAYTGQQPSSKPCCDNTSPEFGLSCDCLSAKPRCAAKQVS
jgi:hypothetical protein